MTASTTIEEYVELELLYANDPRDSRVRVARLIWLGYDYTFDQSLQGDG
jgi:hypothetical protein